MINFRDGLFRIWYWYVSTVDKNAEVLFMNYGYSGADEKIDLDPKDEINRYSIQLYHLLANAVPLQNKDLVEIGCGRGGGLAYVTNRFSPASAVGIDLNQRAVNFSNKHYRIPNLFFKQGDAQQLPLLNSSCDVLINVESSHRYPDMDLFLSEVVRILRPGGNFLFTDFRYNHEMSALENSLKNSGLEIVKEEDITSNVVNSLKLDDSRRRNLVERLVPSFLKKIALNFAGAVGSETYNQFENRDYIYMNYILRKPGN